MSTGAESAVYVSVQEAPFDFSAEQIALSAQSASIGATVIFTGIVRDFEPASKTENQSVPENEPVSQPLKALWIEHYPAMTEQSINAICIEACSRWSIEACRVIHRVGNLAVQEPIVLVGVAAQHRQEAFQACEYIMDYLKTSAPFWKKAIFEDDEHWVEAKSQDQQALKKWR